MPHVLKLVRKKRKRGDNLKMANTIGFKEQELDLTSTVDVARLLVATLRQMNDRIQTLEQEVQRLKRKGGA